MTRALLSLVLVLAGAACVSRGRNVATTNAPLPDAPTTGAADARAPDIEADQTTRTGTGAFNQYRFTYRRTGNDATATFSTPKLPWRDSTVVAAAREIIVAVYDDRSENFPRPVMWNYQGAEVNAIKLEGNNYEYVFVPVKDAGAQEGTKEVASLVFRRLNKGTVR